MFLVDDRFGQFSVHAGQFSKLFIRTILVGHNCFVQFRMIVSHHSQPISQSSDCTGQFCVLVGHHSEAISQSSDCTGQFCVLVGQSTNMLSVCSNVSCQCRVSIVRCVCPVAVVWDTTTGRTIIVSTIRHAVIVLDDMTTSTTTSCCCCCIVSTVGHVVVLLLVIGDCSNCINHHTLDEILEGAVVNIIRFQDLVDDVNFTMFK
mmetsp:Transcript_58201/g.142297  ORF Transcript_58201/g.142297 Transcript_58201/m.142297 type:complete len:204 (-) Transcript_58201:906-1517(-)